MSPEIYKYCWNLFKKQTKIKTQVYISKAQELIYRMLSNKIIYFMLLVNGKYALNIKNFLFRERLTSQKAPQQHTAINTSLHSSIAKLGNGTVPISMRSLNEQRVTESQPSSCKNTDTDLAILIILNAILIFFGFILVSYKVVIFDDTFQCCFLYVY